MCHGQEMLQCGGMIGQATAVDATEVQHPLEDDANPNSKTCNARPAPDPQKLQRRRERCQDVPSFQETIRICPKRKWNVLWCKWARFTRKRLLQLMEFGSSMLSLAISELCTSTGKKVTKAKAKLPREAQKALNPARRWLCTRNQIEASSTPHVRALCWAKGLGQFQSNLHLNISLGRNSTVMRVRDQGSLKKRWHLNAALWLVLLLGISASPERILQTVRPEATKPEERQKAQRFHWIWHTQCHKPSTKTQFLWVVIIGIFLLNGRFTIGLPTLFKMIQAWLWWFGFSLPGAVDC